MVHLNSRTTPKTTTSSVQLVPNSTIPPKRNVHHEHLNYVKEIQVLAEGRAPTSNKVAEAHVRNAKALLVTLFHAVECTEHQTCIVPLCDQLKMFYLVDLGENQYLEAVQCLVAHWNGCEHGNCEICTDARRIYFLDLPTPGMD